MGLCDIHEATLDTRTSFHNQNTFICEISTNILYQYILTVLWFMFIISISISILGFISNVSNHLFHLLCYANAFSSKSIHRYITLRETEYLIYIKKENMIMYGDVLRKLKQHRVDLTGKISDGLDTSNGFV